MGARGMPWRYWDYDPQFQLFHQLSTIGAFILGMSMFVTVCNLVASLKIGKKAPRNPWGGSSLEWQAPTPPTLYNFEKPPIVHELYNYDDLVEVEEDRWERISDAPENQPAGAPPMKPVDAHTAHAAEAKADAKLADDKASEAKAEAVTAQNAAQAAKADKSVDKAESAQATADAKAAAAT